MNERRRVDEMEVGQEAIFGMGAQPEPDCEPAGASCIVSGSEWRTLRDGPSDEEKRVANLEGALGHEEDNFPSCTSDEP